MSLEQDLTHGVKTPHFYHELVYQLIYFTLTDGSQKCIDAAVETLEYLKKKGLLTDEQTKTGFLRIYKEMDELTLDVPAVSINLLRFFHKQKLFISGSSTAKHASKTLLFQKSYKRRGSRQDA